MPIRPRPPGWWHGGRTRPASTASKSKKHRKECIKQALRRNLQGEPQRETSSPDHGRHSRKRHSKTANVAQPECMGGSHFSRRSPAGCEGPQIRWARGSLGPSKSWGNVGRLRQSNTTLFTTQVDSDSGALQRKPSTWLLKLDANNGSTTGW